MRKNIIYITSRVFIAIMIALLFVALQRREISLNSIYIGIIHGGIIGLLFSSFMVFKKRFINSYLRKNPLFFIIIFNSITYLFLLFVGRAISLVITHGVPFRIFPLDDPNFVGAVFFIFSLMLLFNSIDQISLLTGQKQLLNFAMGKYKTAQKESRLIMFIDMEDSTKIAEQIGDIQYLSMLDDFFSAIKYPLYNSKGEIYKYIGDEAIITWDKSQLNPNVAIEFFFQFKDTIKKKEKYFKNQYGVFPQFKAGLHFGSMMISELGSVKKEIALIGDSLNTTSRILGIGKKLNRELVISEILGSQLDNNKSFNLINLGHQDLKGKAENMLLYSVNKV